MPLHANAPLALARGKVRPHRGFNRPETGEFLGVPRFCQGPRSPQSAAGAAAAAATAAAGTMCGSGAGPADVAARWAPSAATRRRAAALLVGKTDRGLMNVKGILWTRIFAD